MLSWPCSFSCVLSASQGQVQKSWDGMAQKVTEPSKALELGQSSCFSGVEQFRISNSGCHKVAFGSPPHLHVTLDKLSTSLGMLWCQIHPCVSAWAHFGVSYMMCPSQGVKAQDIAVTKLRRVAVEFTASFLRTGSRCDRSRKDRPRRVCQSSVSLLIIGGGGEASKDDALIV